MGSFRRGGLGGWLQMSGPAGFRALDPLLFRAPTTADVRLHRPYNRPAPRDLQWIGGPGSTHGPIAMTACHAIQLN
jgi:hypothetical protein